ncbi:TAP42-like protein [Lasiosphaeria miniovina]|uniref:TAP42-like protein n=1 Tax=Lasiosphaeria miniovina TaxID=1954250 RepID=A0AA40ALZ6_9PEZI|nr:TAP42-like protein [Lasiosphaeria miniovina]KAK0718313.1 TAP42-like protein [Lasiosphaeria miniovina]
MDNNPPRSLKATFAAAESQRLALEAAQDTQSTSYADSVAACTATYEACRQLAAQLSLFSGNEGAEDLSTSSLPYLLVDYHLAEVVQRAPSTSLGERRRTLARARDALERFLHLLDGYGLLAPAHRRLLERYTEAPSQFSITAGAGGDPAARREAKIANFRAEKELRANLAYLRGRQQEAEQQQRRKRHGGKNDAVRTLHLAHLEFSAHMAFQALEGMNREWEVLAQAPPAPEHGSAEGRGGQTAQAEEDVRRRRRQLLQAHGVAPDTEYSERLDLVRGALGNGGKGGPILSAQGKPLQPFTLLGNRQELAKGVFRPGHNLPTMTIDEYLDEERRRGGIIEGGGEASYARPEPNEDDYEKADAETLKARAWDEYVEANPKGSGNTLNRG